MFPIADSSGRVVAFSGRIFEPDAESSSSNKQEARKEAKYVNSPETALYSKSSVLFGFDKAKRAIRDEGICVVVEGQMDVIIAHQSGIRNTVAASGTALSKEHLERIRRFTEKVVFAFDPDPAGFSATERATKLALSLGMEARLAGFPQGEDPAALGLRSPDELRRRVKNAQHAVDFFLTAIADKGYGARQLKMEAVKSVLPYIAHLKNRIEQAHFVAETARRIDMREEVIWEELRHVTFSVPQLQKSISNTEEQEEPSRQERIKKHLAGILLWQKGYASPAPFLESAQKELEASTGIPFGEYAKSFSLQEKERMLFVAEQAYSGSNALQADTEELVRNLKEGTIRTRLKVATVALARAEKLRDEKQALVIMGEITILMKSLSS